MLGDILKTIAGPVIGGLFGMEQEERREQSQQFNQAAAQAHQTAVNEANLAAAREQQARNEALQREFAQMGVRWRVEDARAAGLHPLFALGGGGAAFAPNPVVMPYQAAERVREGPSGGWLSDMGQNLSRAVAAQMTVDQRTTTELNHELLRSQIARNMAEAGLFNTQNIKAGQIGPGFPSGGGNAVMPLADAVRVPSVVEVKPAEWDTRGPNYRLLGDNPWEQVFNLPGGHSLIMPSNRLAEAWEDMPVAGQAAFALRNWRLPGEVAAQTFQDAVDEYRRRYYGDPLNPARNRASGKIRRPDPYPAESEWRGWRN